LEEEGMMFIGDKGKILGGFHSDNPQLLPEAKMRSYREAHPSPERQAGGNGRRGSGRFGRETTWVTAFKGGPSSYGDFLLAGPITDAVNLVSIPLRLGGRRLLWDSANAKITNLPEANRLLTREYRPGWEI